MSSSPFHHFGFNHGAKKIVPLKIRNPSIHPSHIMPSPSSAPFNMADMPWSYGGGGGGVGGVKSGQVMEFNAVIRPGPLVVQPQGSSYHPIPGGGALLHNDIRKRKPEPDVIPIPSKQFLTEDIMASHLSKLHLSSEYTSHNIETFTAEDSLLASAIESSGSLSPASSSHDDDMLSFGGSSAACSSSSSSNHRVYMTPQELEERLKKAQRISVCEEVRKLESRTDILPKLLLDRMEKPCKALILWQPPPTLEKLVTNVSEVLEEKEQEEERIRKSNEMMLGEDEPLPDLPEYDDDLDDFEENNNNVATVGDLNSMDMEM